MKPWNPPLASKVSLANCYTSQYAICKQNYPHMKTCDEKQKSLWFKSIICILLISFSSSLIQFSDFTYWTFSKTVMAKLRHSRVGLPNPLLLSTSGRLIILTLFVTFTILILILLAVNYVNNSISRNDLRFIFNSITTTHFPFFISNSYIICSIICRSKDGAGERWVETISWEPRAFLNHHFLVSTFCFIFDKKECWAIVERWWKICVHFSNAKAYLIDLNRQKRNVNI